MTKAHFEILRKHGNSPFRTLDECFGTYSRDKREAFNRCRELMYVYEGYDFKIISKNSFMFTCGFYFIDTEDEKEYFVYITPKKTEKWIVD